MTGDLGKINYYHDIRMVNDELIAKLSILLNAMRPTPLVQLDMDKIELYTKLEYANLFGSVKDRAAIWILKSAIERGEITQGTTVIESSSGNFALALSAYCRFLSLKFIPVIDPNILPHNEALLRASCDWVEKVEVRDDSGGFLKTRLRRVEDIKRENKDIFWTNQYGNIDGAMGHYNLTGHEICNMFSELDYIFIGVSSGGTITGLSMRLKEAYPNIRVIAVDSVGSTIFGGPPKARYIPGIGASIVPQLLRHASIDDVVLVREVDAVLGCNELLHQHQLFVGGSSGSVYWGVKQYFANKSFLSKPKVLFLCADKGIAYQQTVYNPTWVDKLQEV